MTSTNEVNQVLSIQSRVRAWLALAALIQHNIQQLDHIRTELMGLESTSEVTAQIAGLDERIVRYHSDLHAHLISTITLMDKAVAQ